MGVNRCFPMLLWAPRVAHHLRHRGGRHFAADWFVTTLYGYFQVDFISCFLYLLGLDDL